MTTSGYPIQLRLHGRSVFIAGAGRVATRKLPRLIACGAQVRVVALHASQAVMDFARDGRISLALRAAHERDVKGAFLVISATDDGPLNGRLAEAARTHGALVLRVDAAQESDFCLPSLAQTEHVTATVSTGGRAPAASRRLARELAAWLALGPDRFAAAMAQARRRCAARTDAAARLRALADGDLFEACRAGDDAHIDALLRQALEAP